GNPPSIPVWSVALFGISRSRGFHSAFYRACQQNYHDQVQPFAQPDPATISEKAAVKFKPQLYIQFWMRSFPAVNAAGEITRGLKGTDETDGCMEAPLGSQVYERSTWYQDK
ncbi:hypothetical protein JG688_00011396, partial [Phytophthora aleatoria]